MTGATRRSPRAAHVWMLTVSMTLALACSAKVPYQPRDGALDGVPEGERQRAFAETLTKAVKPRIVQVWVDDASYGYESDRVVRGANQRSGVYFINVSRADLYSNNVVFVVDTNERVVDRVGFATPNDARAFIDVLAFYRTRRVAGVSARPAQAAPVE